MDAKVNEKENIFCIKKIQKEQNYLINFIRKKFTKELKIIEKVISLHAELNSYFYVHSEVIKKLGLKYDENIVLNNVLINHIYLSLSIFELLKKGYYGSARVLLRQSFEMLVLGKYCELYANERKSWKMGEASTAGRILNELKSKNKKVDELINLWKKELCKFTHATPFAQQPPRFVINTEFISDIKYTIDLFFIHLILLFHLNNIMHNKTRRFWFGYYKDEFGHYKNIKKLKNTFSKKKKEYFELMRTNGVKNSAIKRWKRIIYQYRLDWK